MLPSIIFIADLAIRVGLSFRVIMRGRPYGITFAWLIIILLIPFLGALTYLLFGENRISERRTRRIRQAQEHYTYWLNSLRSRAPVDWATRDPVVVPFTVRANI
jgi:cardiolipin synthase